MPGPVPQAAVGVVTSFDFTRDRELWRWAPDDVTLYISRTDAVPLDDSTRLVTELNDPALLTRPTREVTRVPVGATSVVYCCTAGSFMGGLDRERALCAAMRDAGAPHAATTSGAVLDALGVLGARRVAVVHPYVTPIGDRLVEFLTSAGVDVVSSRGLGLESRVIGAVDYATTADLVASGDDPRADAIFVSCTLLPTYDLIAPLENELGKPLVTANQATVWSVLRAVGMRAVGPGQRLLQTEPTASAGADVAG